MTLFLHLGMQDSCLLGDCEFLFCHKADTCKMGFCFIWGFFPPDIVKR